MAEGEGMAEGQGEGVADIWNCNMIMNDDRESLQTYSKVKNWRSEEEDDRKSES